MNASSSAQVSWFDYPNVLLRFLLLDKVEVLLELLKLLRQDIGVRDDVKGLTPKLLLHLGHVEAQSVLPGHFVRLREVVNSLVLVHSFVQEGFA